MAKSPDARYQGVEFPDLPDEPLQYPRMVYREPPSAAAAFEPLKAGVDYLIVNTPDEEEAAKVKFAPASAPAPAAPKAPESPVKAEAPAAWAPAPAKKN